MSHISKGDVHAYLDGALGAYPEDDARHIREHLNACPECAKLLEGERRVRQQADSVLAATAQGPVELDPFEVLLARAQEPDRGEGAQGAEGSEPATRARPWFGGRLYSLRWAATIVVSLGAGWMARELTGRSGDLALEAPSERVVAEERDNVELLEADLVAVRESEVAVADGLAGAETPPESRAAAVGGLADADGALDQQARNATVAGRLDQAEPPPEVASAAAAGRVERSDDRGAGRFDDNVAVDEIVVATPTAARQRVEQAPPAVRGTDTIAAARAATPLEEPTPGRTQRRAIGNRPVGAEQFGDAAQASIGAVSLSTRSLLVPGLTVLDVRVAPEGDGLARAAGGPTAASVIVTQELEDGRVFELQFVSLAGTDADGNDAAFSQAYRDQNDPLGRTVPADWARAVREVPGGLAVLTGPLTEAELADLLDRTFGPR